MARSADALADAGRQFRPSVNCRARVTNQPDQERPLWHPHVLSLVTEVPEYRLRTEDVIAEATRIFSGRHQDFERLMPVFANTGIANRYSVRPYDWFREEQGWPERTE